MYEAVTPVFQTQQKVSDLVEIDVSVEVSRLSQIMQVNVQDINSAAAVKFCIFENRKRESNQIMLNRDSAEDFENQQSDREDQI